MAEPEKEVAAVELLGPAALEEEVDRLNSPAFVVVYCVEVCHSQDGHQSGPLQVVWGAEEGLAVDVAAHIR